jgi:hypothetical protein
MKECECNRKKLYPNLCVHCCINAEKLCDTIVLFKYPIIITKEEMYETLNINKNKFDKNI